MCGGTHSEDGFDQCIIPKISLAPKPAQHYTPVAG
jgi:hypothetical protein